MDGAIEEAIGFAKEILRSGDTIQNDLMLRLLLTAAEKPGVERFARAVSIVSQGGVRFTEYEFAALIGSMLAP